ncbi:MAG: hypothetical protein ACKPE3_25405 [Sphaerospermopsis kisseleviana]|nr:hypothetical protein [Sphaerospermopsis sp. FACHB-1094]
MRHLTVGKLLCVAVDVVFLAQAVVSTAVAVAIAPVLIISGQDARTTRNICIFFVFEIP